MGNPSGTASPGPTIADLIFFHVSMVVLKLADNIALGTVSGLDVGTRLVSANERWGESSLVKYQRKVIQCWGARLLLISRIFCTSLITNK